MFGEPTDFFGWVIVGEFRLSLFSLFLEAPKLTSGTNWAFLERGANFPEADSTWVLEFLPLVAFEWSGSV
jgi:hypothetical protein